MMLKFLKKFRRIMSLSLLACLVISLAACGNSSQQNNSASNETGGEVNVFNWSEYLPQSVIDKFEEKYNIKVNYTTYSSNEEMLAKIMAGGSQFDISVATDYMADIMIKQGLAEEIDMSNIPNFKNIGDQFKNMDYDPGNKYTVPYMWGNAVIAVNTGKVKTDVKGYSDLFNEGFKNSLVVLDDQRGILGIILKKLGYSLNETDPVKLEEAKQEFIKLKENIKAYDSDSPKTMLINGEALAGVVWGAEAVLAQQENPDIKAVLPEEGMYLWQDNFIIPKGAPNKKNAELFMNFILEPEISAEISKEFPYANPNLEAHKLMDKETLENEAIYPGEADIEKGEHLKDIGDAIKIYDAIWTDVKAR
ncbi:spermidine/putrescine-binding periplasmic protein precursor [Oxobacter pfennigii]|uniref:Spermidine/putrescine-binding periplasmic protein n=1 Tax=Oxobacter pfennigii TaxID=36849 RepID=A0A0P8WVR0_9CLOT|nr:spermidine/putrescine-binding periplasmic protein precursor [Oxobacter pfennigii]